MYVPFIVCVIGTELLHYHPTHAPKPYFISPIKITP